PSPKATAVVKSISFSRIFQVSFQSFRWNGLWGSPRASRSAAAVMSLCACGLWGDVSGREGVLPRDQAILTWALLFARAPCPDRHPNGTVRIFGRSNGALGALLRVKGDRRKYVAVAR